MHCHALSNSIDIIPPLSIVHFTLCAIAFIATFTCQLLSDTRVKKTLQAPYKLFNAHNTSNEKKGKI